MIRRAVVAAVLLGTLILGLLFGSLNTANVTVDLFFAHATLSLALLLAGFFVVGTLFGALWILVAGVLPAKINLHRSRRSLARLHKDRKPDV